MSDWVPNVAYNESICSYKCESQKVDARPRGHALWHDAFLDNYWL